MKAYRDSGELAPFILNLDIRGKSDISLTPQAPLGQEPLVPFKQEVGWAPELFWMFDETEKFLVPARI